MDKKNTYGCTIPEGYFDSLQTRLSAIPDSTSSIVPLRSRLVPYVCLAACFAALVAVGNFTLKHTASKFDIDENYEQYYYSNAIANAMYVDEAETSSTTSEEDIIAYLIETGTTLNQYAELK